MVRNRGQYEQYGTKVVKGVLANLQAGILRKNIRRAESFLTITPTHLELLGMLHDEGYKEKILRNLALCKGIPVMSVEDVTLYLFANSLYPVQEYFNPENRTVTGNGVNIYGFIENSSTVTGNRDNLTKTYRHVLYRFGKELIEAETQKISAAGYTLQSPICTPYVYVSADSDW